MPDADLQNIRAQIEPIIAEIRTVIEEQAPKLEASKQRLSQLGPKPDKGQPEESADVARDRAEAHRERAVEEWPEWLRLARPSERRPAAAPMLGSRRGLVVGCHLLRRGLGQRAADRR